MMRTTNCTRRRVAVSLGLAVIASASNASADYILDETHYITINLESCVQVGSEAAGLDNDNYPDLHRIGPGVHSHPGAAEEWALHCPVDFHDAQVSTNTVYLSYLRAWGRKVDQQSCPNARARLVSRNVDGTAYSVVAECAISAPDTYCDDALGIPIFENGTEDDNVYVVEVTSAVPSGPYISPFCWEWGTVQLEYHWFY